jgi:hypothetical protein
MAIMKGPSQADTTVWRKQHERTKPHHKLTFSSPSGTLGMEVATRSTLWEVAPTNLKVILSSTHGAGTSASAHLRGASIMSQTRQSEEWKELDEWSIPLGSKCASYQICEYINAQNEALHGLFWSPQL